MGYSKEGLQVVSATEDGLPRREIRDVQDEVVVSKGRRDLMLTVAMIKDDVTIEVFEDRSDVNSIFRTQSAD
jgi:hypothetical protein